MIQLFWAGNQVSALTTNWHSFLPPAMNSGVGHTEKLGYSWPTAKLRRCCRRSFGDRSVRICCFFEPRADDDNSFLYLFLLLLHTNASYCTVTSYGNILLDTISVIGDSSCSPLASAHGG